MSVTPRISTPISAQSYETIRDRIGEILAAEIVNQSTLQTDPVLVSILENTKVYKERFHPLNESEMLAASLFLADANYTTRGVTCTAGEYTFYIDLYGRAATTPEDDGDTISATNLQYVAGIIRSIIEAPQWHDLGLIGVVSKFPKIVSFKRTEEENTQDAGNIMMYRMILQLSATEETVADLPMALAGSDVEACINETDLGFQYTYNA